MGWGMDGAGIFGGPTHPDANAGPNWVIEAAYRLF